MRTELRLILTQYRFGLLGFGLILGAIAATVAAVAAYYSTLGLASCVGTTAPPSCELAQNAAGRLTVVWGTLQGMASPSVILAGLFLGVPIIATEVERGTAVIPWTLAGSRLRWLAPRLLVVGLWLFGASAAIGLALDAVHAAILPSIPITANLADYETRGWLIPARAMTALGAGLLTGAVLGRALPALLAGIVVSGLVVTAVLALGSAWNAGGTDRVGFDDGSIVNALVLVDSTTGAYIDYDSAEALIPQSDPAFGQRFTEVPLGVRGGDSPLIVGRESLALVLCAVVLTVTGGIVADRRRPY